MYSRYAPDCNSAFIKMRVPPLTPKDTQKLQSSQTLVMIWLLTLVFCHEEKIFEVDAALVLTSMYPFYENKQVPPRQPSPQEVSTVS